jgi:hypothetical protein
MARHTIKLSVTEMPHFRRLIEFVADVERHADEQCDLALGETVRSLRIDLLQLMVEYSSRDGYEEE